MENLSVVIITFNEEKNIKRCLDSVTDISDDIVIVDSFSEDATEEICTEYSQVRFIKKEWQGYSKTKNFANQNAKYDYILSLDADEVLSDELKNSILKISKFEGVYEFNRLTNYCGKWVKHCGWYPDTKIRIFNKHKALWEGDFVHETLNVNDAEKVNFLKGDLYHYSYHSIDDHYKQIDKYSSLHAQQMYQAGKKYGIVKLFISPGFKFFKTYVMQLGFMDGTAGFYISLISAKAVKMKYQKLRLLWR